MKFRSVGQSATSSPRSRHFRAGGLALALAALIATPARADITFYNLFKVAGYSQTSDAQPVTPNGFFGTVGVDADTPGDLSGGQVTSSSPLSPMTLSGSDTSLVSYTPSYGSLAALDAALPNGTYTYTLSGGTFDGASATLTTPASDAFASAVPYFTNNAFTALQGVSASSAINLTWNPYATPAGVNQPLTFIGITQVSNNQSVFGMVGDNNFTSTTVAANTLQAGTTYDLDIVYSARIASVPDNGFGDATAFTAYDIRTDLIFTTAVPEPSSLVLLGCAAGIVAVAIGRSRRTMRFNTER
jgi:hypothetical protein